MYGSRVDPWRNPADNYTYCNVIEKYEYLSGVRSQVHWFFAGYPRMIGGHRSITNLLPEVFGLYFPCVQSELQNKMRAQNVHETKDSRKEELFYF